VRLWQRAYLSLSLYFTLHSTYVILCLLRFISCHDIHLSSRSLGECHTWIVIFVLFQFVESASSIFPGTLIDAQQQAQLYHLGAVNGIKSWSVCHETVWVAYKVLFRDLYHSLLQCILHSFMHRLGVHYSWYCNSTVMNGPPHCPSFAYCGSFTCAATMDCIVSHGGV
jgi:hypothetical protein